MRSSDLVIFRELKGFLLKSALNPYANCVNPQDFTRRRKSDFSTTFVFILFLLKKPAGRVKPVL
jgi:hypothetical protein